MTIEDFYKLKIGTVLAYGPGEAQVIGLINVMNGEPRKIKFNTTTWLNWDEVAYTFDFIE